MKRLFYFDDTDMVMAVSQEAAIKFYQEETGFSDKEMADMPIIEIPSSEWPKRTIVTDEFENDEPIKFGLDQWIEQFGENETLIVASTEC